MVYNGRDTHAEITTFRLSRRKAASSVGCDKMIYIPVKPKTGEFLRQSQITSYSGDALEIQRAPWKFPFEAVRTRSEGKMRNLALPEKAWNDDTIRSLQMPLSIIRSCHVRRVPRAQLREARLLTFAGVLKLASRYPR